MNFDQGVWIIGAGGIGSALAEKCAQLGIEATLISRPDYDMSQQADVTKFFSKVNNLPSAIVNTIGMLYDEQHTPEKSLLTFNSNWFYESLRVNTLPIMWLAQSLSKKMSKQDSITLVALSARVASISDNHLGGWYSYRVSKCALNMCIKNISIEWARRFPKAVIYGYHPGTVDTNLSKPFNKNVEPNKLFSPQQAAEYLFQQLQKTTLGMSGNLFDWQGKLIDL